MPEMTGEQLLTLLRKHRIEMPSLAMTGYGDKELAVRVMRLGCNDFIDKPFEAEVIVDRVKAIIEDSVRRISDNRRREFLAGIGEKTSQIAHDLNNIIGGSLSCADMALEEIETDHPARKRLEKLVATSNRAAEICRSLLDKSTLAIGSLKIKTEVTTLVARMEAVLKDIAPENVSVVAAAPKELLWLDADADRLQQALLNLGFNALNAMPDGGTLSISVCVKNECRKNSRDAARKWAVFSVADTGKGFPPEIRKRMFDEGFTTRGKSRGMGLACVRTIVEKEHDGWIDVASVPGRGAMIKLYFPLEAER
jgi:signal transduction histidine kinase